MFIDIHAHLNDEKLIDNVEDVLFRSRQKGVGKIVCVGADYESSISAVALADKHKGVYATIGIHPYDCFTFDQKMKDLIFNSAKNKKVIAVGEIGMDFNDIEYQIKEAVLKNPKLKDTTKEKFIEKQKEVFLEQIKLANEVGLPIMIHMRDATNETIQILENNKNLISKGGIFHCYNGSLETTKRIFDLGFYISIGGAITFKNSKVMPAVLKEIGLDRVMLETDCPYLSPEPYRGRTNEPANIPLIAKKLAEITDTKVDVVEKITTENCYKIFDKLKDEQ